MKSNAELAVRHAAAVSRGVASATNLYAERAENSEIWDVDGKHYVDFAGGIAVLNVGHRHPKVVDAVTRQLTKFTHSAFQVMPYEIYVTLAERLNALAPIADEVKTIFFTTGAEATENAVKIARAATGRSAVIAFAGGFHGRSLFASALTGKVKPYKAPFGPMAAQVHHIPFPSDEAGISVEESLRALEFLFRADVLPEQVAAIVIEPVQGEGGFHIAPPEFLRHLRSLCDQHGIVLIADEVQSGFARTGKMFAIEHSGIEPDLIAMAKSLGGGFPLSAVAGRRHLLDAVPPGGLGGTYGGSPIACAAAHAVLDIIEEEALLARADMLGKRICARLELLARRNDIIPIASIRGLGAMVAFDIVQDRAGRMPDGEAASDVCRRAAEEGLILLSCGGNGETIRILVPLTVTEAVLETGLDRLERALGLDPRC
ncbi:4-aminobutyrate--2-oxoglutarate transaminase [Sphingomonas oleivorans]|uniref:4-aminobutyrate--2-oxoglutarate transaminase n=1 Tax=Sphingomonas oleivorans TaxID=1735121 RepID=A0A2T5FZ23_9SPHN|nr:4-aminobutyrate--2-oxoglutarate transaminase [Sphingomonas oleivorans]PTQ11823.1 4-aminobutyrate--2-oxoglutarate transaminase [Sphingomonas oleivorans]